MSLLVEDFNHYQYKLISASLLLIYGLGKGFYNLKSHYGHKQRGLLRSLHPHLQNIHCIYLKKGLLKKFHVNMLRF